MKESLGFVPQFLGNYTDLIQSKRCPWTFYFLRGAPAASHPEDQTKKTRGTQKHLGTL